MVQRESLHDQLTAGPVSTSTLFQSGSPPLAETLARSAIDFLVVDRQHATPNDETVEAVIRAADVGELPVLVRLSSARSPRVNSVLDAGAAGVIIPQVEDPTTVESVVNRARYSRGRSVAFGTRGGEFGDRDTDDYLEWVDDELLVVPQIETVAGVDSLDAILALENVESIFVGPGDLAFSMGEPFGGEAVHDVVDDVVATARDAGCGAGVWVPTFDAIDRYRERATYVTVDSDLGIVAGQFDEHAGSEPGG